MGSFIDLSGQRFGKLSVIRENGRNKGGQVLWLCKCDCGTMKTLTGGNLRTENAKSCGCGKGESNIKFKTTHGMRHTRFYRIWVGMKDRCLNPKSKYRERYGGRGIHIDPAWLDFENFYNDMFPTYKEKLTLDRIEVNGNYSKNNCRWATMLVQGNNRRTNRMVTIDGVTDTLKNMCRKYKMNYSSVKSRLALGWSNEDAILKPMKRRSS